jgi:hypothetical protein
MQVKIYQQLEQIWTDAGFNVNPTTSDIRGIDSLPAVWFTFPDDQMETAVDEDDQEFGHLINEWEFIFNVIVESTRDNYRIECLKVLTTIKKLIEDNRQIPSDTDGCLARKWEYLGSEIVNFRENKHASGGLSINTLVTYSQLRTDPENN